MDRWMLAALGRVGMRMDVSIVRTPLVIEPRRRARANSWRKNQDSPRLIADLGNNASDAESALNYGNTKPSKQRGYGQHVWKSV